MSIINFPGVADNYPLPAFLVDVNFNQGPVSEGLTSYVALIYANITNGSTGTDGYLFGPTTAIPLNSTSDAINLFGVGSEAAIMYRDFVLRNPNTPLFVAPVQQASGAQAALTLSISGTATVAGTLNIFTPEGPIGVGFSSGDTATEIMLSAQTLVNSVQMLPFTSLANSGDLVLTARQTGERGNLIKAGMTVSSSNSGITVTSPASGFMKLFSGGSGTDATSMETTFEFIEGLSLRFYYQMCAAVDQSTLLALSSIIASQAEPSVGLRQRMFAGSLESSVASAITISTALNQERAELLWLENSDWTPSRLAACAGAAYSFWESTLGSINSVNFDHFGGNSNTAPQWGIPAPLDGSSASSSDQVAALNSGVTPIAVIAGGQTNVVRRITTYFMDNSVNDYRTRDASQVTIPDFFADDVANDASLQFAGCVVGPDPVSSSALPPPISVVTPMQYRSLINKHLTSYSARGLIINLAQTIANVKVLIEPNVPTRISAQVPLQPVYILNQIGLLVNVSDQSQ